MVVLFSQGGFDCGITSGQRVVYGRSERNVSLSETHLPPYLKSLTSHSSRCRGLEEGPKPAQ